MVLGLLAIGRLEGGGICLQEFQQDSLGHRSVAGLGGIQVALQLQLADQHPASAGTCRDTGHHWAGRFSGPELFPRTQQLLQHPPSRHPSIWKHPCFRGLAVSPVVGSIAQRSNSPEYPLLCWVQEVFPILTFPPPQESFFIIPAYPDREGNWKVPSERRLKKGEGQ